MLLRAAQLAVAIVSQYLAAALHSCHKTSISDSPYSELKGEFFHSYKDCSTNRLSTFLTLPKHIVQYFKGMCIDPEPAGENWDTNTQLLPRLRKPHLNCQVLQTPFISCQCSLLWHLQLTNRSPS